jgi:hypothetical protein
MFGILFHSPGVPDQRGPFFFVAMYDGSKDIGLSEDFEAPANLERVLVQLESQDFCEIRRGLGRSAPEGRKDGHPSSHHQFRPSDEVAMVSLHRYLAPVRNTTL